jgi:hypothetical protein
LLLIVTVACLAFVAVSLVSLLRNSGQGTYLNLQIFKTWALPTLSRGRPELGRVYLARDGELMILDGGLPPTSTASAQLLLLLHSSIFQQTAYTNTSMMSLVLCS